MWKCLQTNRTGAVLVHKVLTKPLWSHILLARHYSGHTSSTYLHDVLYEEAESDSTASSCFTASMGKRQLQQQQQSGQHFAEQVRKLCDTGQVNMALHFLSSMDQLGIALPDTAYLAIFKACSKTKALIQTKYAHFHFVVHKLELTRLAGEHLVLALARCGALEDAHHVFLSLPGRTVFSWTAMISGLTDYGQGREALQMYHCMEVHGVVPDKYTYVSLFKACSTLLDLEEAQHLFADVEMKGLSGNVFIGSSLVSVYAKCGSIMEAEIVFDNLVERNVVSWNAMITAYVEHDQEVKALLLFRQMYDEVPDLDQQTFLMAIQACGTLAKKAQSSIHEDRLNFVMCIEIGKALHGDAQKRGFTSDVFVCTALLNMYSKCRNILEAENLFDRLSECSAVSWNIMLSAYCEQGQQERALPFYRQMQEEGVIITHETVTIIFSALGFLLEKANALVQEHSRKLEFLTIGKALHDDAERLGFMKDVLVGSTVLGMYGKSGSFIEAEGVFGGQLVRNVILWNAMLAVYLEQAQGEKALQLYRQMQEEGVSSNQQTLLISLQACGVVLENEEAVYMKGQPVKLSILHIGRALHANCLRKGFMKDMFVRNTLISLYGKCGSIVEAEHVFDGYLDRDLVSWNVMLSAYVDQAQGGKALQMYTRIKDEAVNPKQQTYAILIRACGSLAENKEVVSSEERRVMKAVSLKILKAIHTDLERKKFTTDTLLCNILLTMYWKCGSILEMEGVFDTLPKIDIVTWCLMLSAYVEKDHGAKALQLYRQMQEEGCSPNHRTLAVALQACGSLLRKGPAANSRQLTPGMPLDIVRGLHVDAQQKGLASNPFVGSSLVSIFGKCGSIAEAELVFNGLFDRTYVCWCAMLSAYIDHGQGEKALELYMQMRHEEVSLDVIGVVCVIQACILAGVMEICMEVYLSIVFAGLDFDLLLANTLIRAFGSCALMKDAQAVFDRLPEPDVISWNACIAGYAQDGSSSLSLQMLEEMQGSDIKPDEVTFLSILCACSHASLVKEAVECFEVMSKDSSITPNLKHYLVMIDLLGRAGDFEAVENIFSTMTLEADISVWLRLLSACQGHGNLELARQAFDSAVNLNPKDGAAYVLMSNVYADAGFQGLADEIENLRCKEGAWRMQGLSWNESEQGLYVN